MANLDLVVVVKIEIRTWLMNSTSTILLEMLERRKHDVEHTTCIDTKTGFVLRPSGQCLDLAVGG